MPRPSVPLAAPTIAARSLAVALLLAACSASPPPAPASAGAPPTPASPSSVAPSPAPHRADCRADCRASLPSPADRRYADCLDALACDAIRTSLAAPAAPLRPVACATPLRMPYRIPSPPREPRAPRRLSPWMMVSFALGALGTTAVLAATRRTAAERCRARCVAEANACLSATRAMTPARRSIQAFACEESARFCASEQCRFAR